MADSGYPEGVNERHFPRVGVIGAGQLARMMAIPANDLGIELIALAESNQDSAAQVAPFEIGSYKSKEDLLTFARGKDVITFEHELTPPELLRELEMAGCTLFPHGSSFLYSQDKGEMRTLMADIGLPNPHWFMANDYEDFQSKGVAFSHGVEANPFIEFPLVIKAPSGGYDGRGVWICYSEEEIEKTFRQVNRPLLVEEAVNFEYEASVMVARSPHGQASTWAPTKTIQKNGICTMTITPVPEMSKELSQRVQEAALHIAQEIKLVGVMAVELFIRGDEFLINELALRPHNSGHWSIEGSVTSQFEQHLRAVLDLPLGDTALRSPYTVMGNILGGADSSDDTDMFRPYLHLMAREPHLKFHQYGKSVRPGRKIGHLTLTGDNWNAMVSEMEHAIAYMQGEIDE